VRVSHVSSAREFLAATHAYRSRDPLRTNLIGSIAEGVVQGRRYVSESWTVVTQGADVVAAAVRTAPHSLVLGPMWPDVAPTLARHLAAVAREAPGVSGPETAVCAFLQELGRPWHVDIREVLRVLGELTPPDPMPAGALRRATDADAELLASWHRAFLIEAGLPVPEMTSRSPRQEPGGGSLWIWEVAGEPVAMAGHAPIVRTRTATVGRIGPVYTVPAFRRRGIGAAATSLVAGILQAECDRIMLLADVANATSNGVYERLGFAAADGWLEVAFD